MERSDLNKILRKNFTKFSDSKYVAYACQPLKASWYFHKGLDNFKLIVLEDDDAVYQAGTEADIIGIELKTPAALRKRFESFTGEKLK